MSEVPLYTPRHPQTFVQMPRHPLTFVWESSPEAGPCEDRVLDGPASWEKGSKGRNWLDCIRGKGVRALRASQPTNIGPASGVFRPGSEPENLANLD